MPLTLFLAICILGCDVLIYFLFQWTLGEKSHIKRRRLGPKRRMASGQQTELIVVPARKKTPVQRAKVLPYVKREEPRLSRPERVFAESRPIDRETAYRRRATAFASPKQNSKLAV